MQSNLQLLGLIGEEPTDIDGIIERSGLTPDAPRLSS